MISYSSTYCNLQKASRNTDYRRKHTVCKYNVPLSPNMPEINETVALPRWHWPKVALTKGYMEHKAPHLTCPDTNPSDSEAGGARRDPTDKRRLWRKLIIGFSAGWTQATATALWLLTTYTPEPREGRRARRKEIGEKTAKLLRGAIVSDASPLGFHPISQRYQCQNLLTQRDIQIFHWANRVNLSRYFKGRFSFSWVTQLGPF